jgi:hypothetical protein
MHHQSLMKLFHISIMIPQLASLNSIIPQIKAQLHAAS